MTNTTDRADRIIDGTTRISLCTNSDEDTNLYLIKDKAAYLIAGEEHGGSLEYTWPINPNELLCAIANICGKDTIINFLQNEYGIQCNSPF